MALCLVLTLPLEFLLGARVYRRFRAAALAIFPVAIVFSVWDIFAIAAGNWTYNSRFVTGLQLAFGLPVEELAFFIAVPICGLLTYQAVEFTMNSLAHRRTESHRNA